MNSFSTIKAVFEKAWDKSTCYPVLSRKWRNSRPEVGQCAVTALILQEQYGGEIVYNKRKDHFFNKLPSGDLIDITIGQFRSSRILKVDSQIDRSTILNSKEAKVYKTKSRYNLLKKRVITALPSKI